MSTQINVRYSGRTTIRLTPDSARTRTCHRHSERRAIAVRITTHEKPRYAVSFAPECAECSGRKVKAGEKLEKL